MKGMKICHIYGFGRRKLFEIVRTGRKEWSFSQMEFGEHFVLRLENYVHGMTIQPMVCLRRKSLVAHDRVTLSTQVDGLKDTFASPTSEPALDPTASSSSPSVSGSAHLPAPVPADPDSAQVSPPSTQEENVCFFKKSKKYGYRCILMSEVITQGKVSTGIAIERQEPTRASPYYHYVMKSQVSGVAEGDTKRHSCTLSLSDRPHKHIQTALVTGGSDELIFLALAVSFDILNATSWKECRVY